jgi:hypothetical protein
MPPNYGLLRKDPIKFYEQGLSYVNVNIEYYGLLLEDALNEFNNLSDRVNSLKYDANSYTELCKKLEKKQDKIVSIKQQIGSLKESQKWWKRNHFIAVSNKRITQEEHESKQRCTTRDSKLFTNQLDVELFLEKSNSPNYDPENDSNLAHLKLPKYSYLVRVDTELVTPQLNGFEMFQSKSRFQKDSSLTSNKRRTFQS